MRPISSLLAVAASTAGLFLACGGGLGSPSDGLLGNDPYPASGENPGNGTDPPGNSNDPIGSGCVCPAGHWNCGSQISLNISLKDGICVSGNTPIDLCTGRFTADGLSGTIRPKGDGVELCIGSQCQTCSAGTTQDDAGVNDTGVKDTGIKDTSIPDVAKDVAKEAAAVCASSCNVNSDCQSTCPPAGSGLFNCCDPNAFVCYQDTSCPGP